MEEDGACERCLPWAGGREFVWWCMCVCATLEEQRAQQGAVGPEADGTGRRRRWLGWCPVFPPSHTSPHPVHPTVQQTNTPRLRPLGAGAAAGGSEQAAEEEVEEAAAEAAVAAKKKDGKRGRAGSGGRAAKKTKA